MLAPLAAALLSLAAADPAARPPPAEGGRAPAAPDGKALFESRALGTNGKACVDCHARGARLTEVAQLGRGELEAYVNSCIAGQLAGKPFAEGAPALRALADHVRALAGAAARR